MMEGISTFILNHATMAPFVIFGLIILAGLNIPISIDILLVLTAFIAGTILPERALLLFAAFTLGCIVSAWVAYSVGRFFGTRLFEIKFFAKFLSQSRLQSIEKFYKKYGVYTLLVGRFIPFGVRNCIFITTGISRMPFLKFTFFDSLACVCWSSLLFLLCYSLSHNMDLLLGHIRVINIAIFSCFAIAVIGVIWYKVKVKRRSSE